MALQDLLKFNTMSKKFLIPTLFFTVIMLGGLGAFMVKKNNDTVRSMINSKANTVIDLLAAISTTYILNYDLHALEGFVTETLNDREVVFAIFLDPNKKPLTENSSEPQKATLKHSVYDREIKGPNGAVLGHIKIGYSEEGLSSNLKSGIQYVVISTLIALGLLGLGVTILFSGITRPLVHLVAVMDKVAHGDLTVAVESKSGATRDEIGLLANAFAQMSAGLKGVIKKIQNSSQQMTSVVDRMQVNTKKVNDGAIHQAKAAEKTSSSIEEMNASVKNISENIDGLSSSALETASSLGEMSTAISQVASSTTELSSSMDGNASALLEMSGSIKEVAGYIDTLSASAEEATTSITEMNASIKEVGKNAKESALLTEKVSKDAAELGLVAIEKTIEGMEKIKKTVDKSAYVIAKLDERTEHIGKILTVIDEVTRQTNLLALNAAILAAQAGNEGKGFAVVADEIKSLADRTATSTKEISQLIRDVQTEAKDAVISIKEGSQSVEEGVGLSINARESLSKILASSKRSSDMSRQIENATLEQVKATSQVTQLMEKVNVMVQRINSSMKELERGTRHITETSEKMKSITRQVKNSTEEQARGSKQISNAVENITERIQQIANAINEQKRGNEVITKSILDIHQITQLSLQMVQQMNQAAEELINQATLLKSEVNHFKI
jgi:methyl-accepting chemotaxis protein